MSTNTWLKQDQKHPLFTELLWSRPENRLHAGKLLIIGGNLHGFAAPATAYSAALKAGIGSQRVLLPDAIRKIVGNFMPEADFGTSTPSGSFASASLDTMLEHAAWADGVLLSGDLGRNSETAIVLEKFTTNYTGQLVVTKDAADYFLTLPLKLATRPRTVAVVSFAQLQKFATNLKVTRPLTFDMDLIRLVDCLQQLTNTYQLHIVMQHQGRMIVAGGGKVSTTILDNPSEIWRVTTAAQASVWSIQQPAKQFEALTTSFLNL